ncbi:zinc finger Y-chromosomal protein 1 [Diplogelasinospora grovesii]|uniref:Zinc finger Y-chromosomal protein 1 n=1 Tax=Diplogelasinospora grovesii TaxID=303347 RepID=A0AAN6NBM3_9PEZI|nr:zinc finger Y-chromosomal protein 1 [Diplogelasinospora grovesii]
MEPSTKRRRLAPKVPDPPAQPSLPPAAAQPPAQPTAQAFPQEQHPPQHYPPPEPVAPSERHDFEAFARHLQDAAMHIYQQTLRSQHTSVSVLMLRWEEDGSVDKDLLALEKVFRERYNYHVDRWQIPATPNPSIKLGAQIISFLEHARPDHLYIIYYAGNSYVGSDGQLYWASNTREDAAKLKWDGVRCLFDDAQCEILLLLDSCAIRDAATAGSHGAKQAIAAYTPEQSSRERGPCSFTASLTETLDRLSTGRPFSVQRLYEELLAQRQQESAQALARLTNGASKSLATLEKAPVIFTLTPSKGQGIVLVPLDSKNAQLQSPPQSADADNKNWNTGREEQPLSPQAYTDLTFDEARVLVCTTFVGDASPDMTFFHQWLHNTPPLGSKITVEGMFIGPPTMLLISMPHSVWNIVQHDKVCCFLGYITSHNMIHLYQRLVSSSSPGPAKSKEVEDGRILLQAREAAASSPPLSRRDPASHCPAGPQDTPKRQENHRGLVGAAQASIAVAAPHGSPNQVAAANPKEEVEDSAEMQEAAEQLKALSHVRHAGGDTSAALDRQNPRVGDSISVRHPNDPGSSPEGMDSGADETHYGADYGTSTPSSRPKVKRALQKHTVKQETQCSHCSHAPFKDSSSLRKHIAAAHTRPFPCAFSFAGCSSTFGSKNEWKRHIASQHLCLTYYRCSTCPQSTAEGKGNEFNRKDLFTQHLRRMHAPFAIKKALLKGDSKLQAEWESHVKEMQQSCLVTRRQPPQRSACPKSDCQSIFEGPGSWDEWTEHVGRHMEKGEAQRLGVDRLLAKWALEEGIIERQADGEYKLCTCNGHGSGSGEREVNNSSFLSDGGKQEDEDPSITVAISAPASGVMDVD